MQSATSSASRRPATPGSSGWCGRPEEHKHHAERFARRTLGGSREAPWLLARTLNARVGGDEDIPCHDGRHDWGHSAYLRDCRNALLSRSVAILEAQRPARHPARPDVHDRLSVTGRAVEQGARGCDVVNGGGRGRPTKTCGSRWLAKTTVSAVSLNGPGRAPLASGPAGTGCEGDRPNPRRPSANARSDSAFGVTE